MTAIRIVSLVKPDSVFSGVFSGVIVVVVTGAVVGVGTFGVTVGGGTTVGTIGSEQAPAINRETVKSTKHFDRTVVVILQD
jgi:hypothetical protein